jgi:hypothetical protein
MSVLTPIDVRALAYGGKFIGSHVGYALINIYGPGSPDPMATGLTDKDGQKGTDGSGDLQAIMGESYRWGVPIDSSGASKFTANIPLDEPTVLKFVASSQKDKRIAAVDYRLALPGVPLVGNDEIVMVLPGLLAELTYPEPNFRFSVTQTIEIKALVRMMCGCEIQDPFWPPLAFIVTATVSHAGGSKTVPLDFVAASVFVGEYEFTQPGPHSISILAHQVTNGNRGNSLPVTVDVR